MTAWQDAAAPAPREGAREPATPATAMPAHRTSEHLRLHLWVRYLIHRTHWGWYSSLTSGSMSQQLTLPQPSLTQRDFRHSTEIIGPLPYEPD
jgi:hypothetical protein